MSAVSFYIGDVIHARRKGPRHDLRYRLAYVLVDIDRLDEANGASAMLGVGRKRLMWVSPRDHGDGVSDDLAVWVRRKLRAEGVERPCAKIELFTLPRMLGFVFNPLSVYYIYDDQGALHHVLYEVNNTFCGRHFYLTRISDVRDEHYARKEFYVSPFFDVEGEYGFRITPPDEKLNLRINYRNGAGEPALTASLSTHRKKVTTMRCLRILVGFPLMTIGVVAAIHWEALKLFVKGARYRAAPDERRLKGDRFSGHETVSKMKRKTA